jgi:hypothetical protein
LPSSIASIASMFGWVEQRCAIASARPTTDSVLASFAGSVPTAAAAFFRILVASC